MMIATMNGILFHILKDVVHPAHIPLHRETQSAHICWSRNHWIGGGFFRGDNTTRVRLMQYGINFFEKTDDLKILTATMNIW